MSRLVTLPRITVSLCMPCLLVVMLFSAPVELSAQSPTCDAHFIHHAIQGVPDSVRFYADRVQSRTAFYRWSFGDGTYSHEPAPSHRYAHPGTYVACLTVSDSTAHGTCTDTWCDTIVVTTPSGPTCDARFQHYANPHNPDSLHFSPLRSHTQTTRYQWSFGDGTYSHARDPWHVYSHPGTYLVCLTLSDSTAHGTCTDTWCDSVVVAASTVPSCSAHFIHFSVPSHPDSVHFYPDQMRASSTARFLWSFGDGTYSHDAAPWHRYAHSGTYTVCLTVTDSTASGVCTDTWCDHRMVVPFVQLYPNPATRVMNITVAGAEGALTLRVFDDKGRLLHSQQAGNGTAVVNTDGMSTGTYFYQLSDGESVLATGKFVVVSTR